MPLVPLEIVKKWYKKDSFVYKQFLFLFVNPLWNKTVPQGFSLCPYFWFSMFSLCFLRPFIGCMVVIGYGIKKLCLGKLVAKTDDLARRCYLFVCDDMSRGLGIATFAGFLFSVFSVAFLSTIGIIVYTTYEAGILFILLNALALFVTLVACKKYEEKNEYKSDRCQVEWYVRGVALLCMVVAFGFYRAEAKEAFLHYPVDLLCGTGAILWWMVSTVATLCKDGIVWVCLYLWDLVTHSAVYTCLGVAFVLVAAIMGYVVQSLPVPAAPVEKEEGDEGKQQDASYVVSRLYYASSIADLDRKNIRHICNKYLKAEFAEFCKEYRSEEDVEGFVKLLEKAYNDELAQKKAAEELRKVKCRKATALVEKILYPVHVCLIGPMLFCLKTVGVFLCLIWELIKARKQGACPYIRFEK